MSFDLYIQFILLFIVLLFAIFILSRGIRKPSNIIFAIWVVILDLVFFFSYFSINTLDNELTLFYIRTVMFIGTFNLLLFLLFVDYFPENKRTISNKTLIFASIFTAITAIAAASPFMFTSATVHSLGVVEATPGVGFILFVGLFLYSFFIGIRKLVGKYRSSYGKIKAQLRLFIFSFTFCFSIVGICNILFPNLFKITSLIPFGNSAVLVLMLTTGYAIIKHKLFDTYLAIRAFITFTLSFIAVYIILFLIVSSSINFDITTQIPLFVYVAGVDFVSLLTIPSVLKLISSFGDRFLFKKTLSQSTAIETLYDSLNKTIEFNKINEHLLESLKKIFGLSNAKILKENDSEFAELNKFVDKYDHGTPVSVDDVTDFVDKQCLQNLNISILYPVLTDRTKIKLILVIYDKSSKEPFYSQDYKLLKEIIGRWILSIENATLYEEVLEFNKTLQDKVDQATKEVVDKNDALQKSNEALDKAFKELEETARQERDMLDIMGHELRTPATIVKNATYLIEGELKIDPLDIAKVIKNNERAKESIEREIKLINTFIDTAKIDNNRFEINIVVINLQQIVKEATEQIEFEAKEKNLTMEYIDNGSFPPVAGDPDKIREVLDNLLSNSLKYTNVGGIKTYCKLSDDKKYVLACVEDTGEGIKSEDIPELFQKFKRLHPYTKDSDKDGRAQIVRPGGTGLGLYVVKRIIDLHHGQIHIDSTVGKGTIFTISLPIITDESKIGTTDNHNSMDMFKKLGLKR